MKITPMGQGSGAAGVMAQPSGQTVSPDRKAAAKQAFLGQTPTKVSESDNYVDPQVAHQRQNVRSIRMRTNASPDRAYEQQLEAQVADPATQTTEQTAEVEVTKPLSPQFAALAKQRRALQVKEGELAKREQELSGKHPQGIDPAALKANPLKVLLESGVTYDQLTQSILSNQSGIDPAINELKAEIKALKEGVDKNLSERDQQAEQQVLAELKRETDKLTATGDEFEMIRATRSQSKVTELIHRIWKQSGEVLDVTEAAQLIENELVNDNLKIASLGKMRAKLSPQEQQMAAGQPRGQMRSLSNRDTARPVLDKRARAIAAALGQLRK
jgi:hypothetical protein